MSASEGGKGVSIIPKTEREKLYLKGSVSAGYEEERASQIVGGISKLLNISLREAVEKADSTGILERLGVESDSLLPKVKEFTNRFKQREKLNLAGQCVIDGIKGTIYRDPKLPKAG